MNTLFLACTPTAAAVSASIDTLDNRLLKVKEALLSGDIEHAVSATFDFTIAMQDLVNAGLRLTALIENADEARLAAEGDPASMEGQAHA
ncbi:hypothetical protein M2322_002796 [Rhodoblastus acidophilus]|uniref:hypothetical protein n=1 Tax=Rhodoblastus acidophilus TaxID=1074 RepID=UPI00222403EF|nr:hypothetical protein [Rhodoblastus acidophilus]MCW2317237.1 hypothetical protein [Rhodoblastus acidophilus]